LKKARQYFDKTVDSEPDYLNLGRIYLAEKDYFGAIRYAGQAVEQKPDMSEGYIILGTAHLLSDDLARAESNFLKARELDPKLILADYNLGLIRLVQKKYDKALEFFSQIVKLSPKIKEAYVCKAAILHIENDLKAAKKEADQAVNIDPGDFLGHLAQGAYRHSGALFTEFSQSWFRTRKHLNLEPSDTAASFTLANIYHRNGLFRPEINTIQESFAGQSEKNVFMLMMEARAEGELGHYDRAVELYKAAMKLDSKLVTPYMELGDLAAKRNELPKAIDYYQKASQIAPQMSGLYFVLGDLYLSSNDSKKAVSNYQIGLKYAPKSSFGHNQIAWVLAEKEKKYKTALTYARKAHELNPKNVRISDTLGWIYYRLKRYKNADEIYSKIDRGNISKAPSI
jgi:tetratricopeptide (TPR) repeat protein